ncbi:MAG TPA: hypothetical protein PLJ66_01700 [Methanofastidiosum sp.]|nr:hypothetical protein [Methanofastidiosum sp.]HQM94383.1 hypothetical protein [Methanofastidiosum sp.]HQQ48247.1 hypothetical protein [Methanofastidiosum sp.]
MIVAGNNCHVSSIKKSVSSRGKACGFIDRDTELLRIVVEKHASIDETKEVPKGSPPSFSLKMGV